jgi:hypothetical protein
MELWYHCNHNAPIVPAPRSTTARCAGKHSQHDGQERESTPEHPAVGDKLGVIARGQPIGCDSEVFSDCNKSVNA